MLLASLNCIHVDLTSVVMAIITTVSYMWLMRQLVKTSFFLGTG